MNETNDNPLNPRDQSAFGFMGEAPVNKDGHRVGVVGATGLVGRTVLKVLAERRFPVGELHLYATSKSEGLMLETPFGKCVVETLKDNTLPRLDFVFMAAGAESAKKWGWKLARRGAVVIDKSSYFRDKDYAPLVVPEVNPESLTGHRNIIATPNCTTIPLVVALKPLHDEYELRWVTVVSFQSVSGHGSDGIVALERELDNQDAKPSAFPKRIAYNAIPWIGEGRNMHSGEERKVIRETRRILGLKRLPVKTTAVRIPTLISHALAVHIEFQKCFDYGRIIRLLENAPGVTVIDQSSDMDFPTPLDAIGRDDIMIGRIRRDRGRRGLAMWIVADNLRKGAATNAIQIAEALLPTEETSGSD